MISATKIGWVALGLVFVSSLSAEPMGRLFFTPEQRIQMEYSYLQDGDSGNSNNSLTVNGIVQKDGGKRTVWINGVPQHAGNSDDHSPGALPVAVPGIAKPVRVKVGQKVLVNTLSDSEQ